MFSQFNLIISFILLIAGYCGAGLIFKKILRLHLTCLAEKFLFGAGIITFITLISAVFFPSQLRFVSFLLIALGASASIVAVVSRATNSSVETLFKRTWPYLLLFIMTLPLFLGNINVRLWGDEMNFEAPLTRSWLQNNTFLTPADAWYGSFDYPRLWAIMIYQTLFSSNILHEAAGKWLTIFIAFCGSLFVFKTFQDKLGFKKRPSLIWASFWLVLVFGSMFAWSASWYYEIIISMLVMLSFYYIIVAKNSLEQKIDLKIVALSAVFMAMITGIRPEGFLYLPLLILLIFIGPLKSFKNTFKQNSLATLLVVVPSAVVYFAWQTYTWINQLPKALNVTEIAGQLGNSAERLWPTLRGMFQIIVFEWSMTGFWLFCLAMSIIFAGLVYKKLNVNEKPLLLLLLVPIYKFVMMFALNLTVLSTVRMGRHIMQTAPLVYFLLGFLIYKFFCLKLNGRQDQLGVNFKRSVGLIILMLIFLMQLSLGSIYSRLPGEINVYFEDWVSYIREDQPKLKNVQLIIPENPPPGTRIHPIWRYYASGQSSIYSPLSSSIKSAFGADIADRKTLITRLALNGTDALFLYAPDKQLADLTKLDLKNENDYLLKINKNAFEIIRIESRPYSNTWGIPFRNRALQSFYNDLKFWP